MVKAKQKQVSHDFTVLYDWEISRSGEPFPEFGKVTTIFNRYLSIKVI